jgi:hypothetical protein
MAHQGYDLQLTRHARARLARELLPGRHRTLHRGRQRAEPTPWRAVQRAAWEALKQGGMTA